MSKKDRIPKTKQECFEILDEMLSQEDKNAIVEMEDTIELHFTLGMWIRNNWGLWGGSRLQKYFVNKNVFHPDDMSDNSSFASS